MNAQIWLYLKSNRNIPDGFAKIRDFYPPGTEPDTHVSLPALLLTLSRQLFTRMTTRRTPT
jgi:hypothetical protein